LKPVSPVVLFTALAGAAVLIGLGPVARANDATDPVDTLVQAEMEQQKIPGLALAIVRGGQVTKARGYGLANVEHQVPVKPETIFQSGSVGKQFTAAVVMGLVEDGQLGLDDSIRKYFPDAPKDWQEVTVRRLLTHTSGVVNYTEDSVDYRRDYTEDQLVQAAYKLGLDFAPGSRWSYSNTGYVLLGALVRKVTGRFYGDVLKDRVFDPLGMKTARVISEADIVPNRAAGYRLVDGKLANQEWVSPSLNTTADGSLYLSLLDLIAWDQGLRAGRVLKPESWKEVYTPIRLRSGNPYPYGFGWSVTTLGGQEVHAHGGSWQGFRTSIARYLGSDVTVIALANLAEAEPGAIAEKVAGRVDSRLAPPELRPLGRTDAAAEARLRDTLQRAAAGTLRPKEHVFPPRVAALNRSYRARLGPLGAPTRVELLKEETLGDDRITTWDVAYGPKVLRVRLAIAADGRLADFDAEARSGS
jgi:CubicO group peptidase (beta-lactamase class C family)